MRKQELLSKHARSAERNIPCSANRNKQTHTAEIIRSKTKRNLHGGVITVENEENVVRLAKPQKKGILRIVFSRFLLVFLLLALEIGLLVYVFISLNEHFPSLIYILRIFSLIMVIYLFNCSMDSSAKLTWMLLISVFPIVGTGILLFTQTNLGHRVERKMICKQIDATRDCIPQSQKVIKALEHDGSGTDDLSTYLSRTGCFTFPSTAQASLTESMR